MHNQVDTLPKGTMLRSSEHDYRIERVLGSGSFGITYLASYQDWSGVVVYVALKEFFMNEINGREGTFVTTGSKDGLFADYRHKFAREAKHLTKLNHPNIIKVMEYFEYNNTSYYTMEYIDGGSLDDYIKRKGALDESQAINYANQIGNALSYMHSKGMLHLDLKPKNIMMRGDGSLVLIDFGLSKQYDSNGDPESSTRVGGGTQGYAPIEQADYCDSKEFPVTIDVYALGATLFKMLTGQTPPVASSIVSDGFPDSVLVQSNVSLSSISCIKKAMAASKHDRFHSVLDLLACLNNVKRKTQKKKVIFIITGFIVLVMFLFVLCTIRKFHHLSDSFLYYDSIEYDKSLTDECLNIPNTIETCKNNNLKFTIGNACFTMVFVPGGSFRMGCDLPADSEWDDFRDEMPEHYVTLDSYYIGETEVTRNLWNAVMGEDDCGIDGNLPKTDMLKYKDCCDFIHRLNRITNYHFSLPTEAEWEFAARGGTNDRREYSGSDNIDDVAWYEDNSREPEPVNGSFYTCGLIPTESNIAAYPVASKKPNSLGIYDMSGNVSELCKDWYGPYSADDQVNPVGPNKGERYVERGGDLALDAKRCRVSRRSFEFPGSSNSLVGFRLALHL